MKKELIKLANHLDRVGLAREADYLDEIIKKANSQNQTRLSDDIDECKGTRHEVKGGENLEGIAKLHFEDQKSNRSDLQYEKWEDLYYEILRVNAIDKPDFLDVNQEIMIPSKEFYYE